MAEAFSPTGIRFENVEKRYGSLFALRRVSFEIAAGECAAFAGRNGSGKTTLLRIAAGLVRPSAGMVHFFGPNGNNGAASDDRAKPSPSPAVRDTSGDALKRSPTQGGRSAAALTGFVAHATMVYDELTAEENLVLFSKLQGITAPA